LASKYLLEVRFTVAFFMLEASDLPGATEKYLNTSGFMCCLSVVAALATLKFYLCVEYLDSNDY
jgi:hypothetical protein